MKNYIILSVIALMLSNCTKTDSEEVVQNEIHAKYVLSYDSNKDTTFAGAKFYTLNSDSAKSIVVLSGSSQVKFDNNLLDTNNSFSSALFETIHHGIRFDGRVTNGSFEYTNNDGDVMNNSIQFSDTMSYNIPNNTIYKDSGYVINWNGASLGQGERANIIIYGSNDLGSDGAGVAILGNDTLNANSIFISPEKLIDFEIGKQYYIRFNRNYSFPIQEGLGEIEGIFIHEDIITVI